MTPEEKQRLAMLENIVGQLVKTDRYTFMKISQFLDGRNIQFGLTTGTKFGTTTSQKIGFWNTTPVIQPTAVGAASGGANIDSEARTAINNLLIRLRNIGIIAT